MKPITKRILFVLLAVSALPALPALHAVRAPQVRADETSPVIVGIPLPLSGGFKDFGVMMKNSFDMAEISINGTGGINGRPLKVVYADDRGSESLAGDTVERLAVDEKSLMLVGGYASNPTCGMARTAERLNVPFLICTASADNITQRGWRNVFRLNPPISEYTQGLEDFLFKGFKAASMALIYENSMFGTDGAMRMMEFCRDKAVEVRAIIGYEKEKADPGYFRPMLATLTGDSPDVIYMISYLEDAVSLTKAVRQLNISTLLCGGGGGFTLPQFIERAGTDADRLLTASLWSSNLPYPGARAYADEYVNRHGTAPDYHGAEAYSSLLVAADALRRAESLDPQGIRRALNATFMLTPFGPVKFFSYNDFERQNSTRTQVLQVIDGRFETIWPLEFATKAFSPPAR